MKVRIVVYGNFSAISQREQVNLQWDEDEVPPRLVGIKSKILIGYIYIS
jgi:hypothetical protein